MGVKLRSWSGASRRCFTSCAAMCSVLVFLAAARGEVVTLYDGTQQAVTPDSYAPAALTFDAFLQASVPGQTYDSLKQATYVNTAGNAALPEFAAAGYSNYTKSGGFVPAGFPALDRQAGYSIFFTLEILSASQSNSNRAGVSIIAVSSDVAAGATSSVEIGFQDGRIFALNDNFSAAAVATTSFDPVDTGFVDYQLDVAGSEFDLFANGTLVLEERTARSLWKIQYWDSGCAQPLRAAEPDLPGR